MPVVRAAALLLALFPAPPLRLDDAPIRGFSAGGARSEREWERKFAAIPDPDTLREAMRVLSARPHHLGSPRDSVNAAWMAERLRGWGLDARIETFQVLFPTPRERVVELVAPRRFTARLREPSVKADPTSGQQAEQLPTYNAYSPDGDVTAPLVYVNYGIPEDYARLERLGVSVKGAIVIARYGRSWRGIKPKVAAEHGAVGCLIYSDPRDDGYHAGDTYPEGPFRPREGVQRGSVLDMPLYSGDPLTPGVGATADAKRLDRRQAPTSCRQFPSSRSPAPMREPLLAAIGGRPAPDGLGRRLPITYHVGPGPAKVRLKLRFDWRLVPAYDVIATDPRQRAARRVGRARQSPRRLGQRRRGSDLRRDRRARGGARVRRAAQAGLAAAAHHRARALGRRRARCCSARPSGPRRTRMSCAQARWPTSTPTATDAAAWARAARRRWRGSCPRWHARFPTPRPASRSGSARTWARSPPPAMRTAVATRARRSDLIIGPLGSGSDYTAFYHHLGIPSLNLGFGGEDDGGIYHSIYDSFHWFTTFSDTVVRLWPGAGADGRPRDDASRERRRAALRVRPALRAVSDEPQGGAGPAADACGTRSRSRTARSTRARFVAMNDPRRPLRGARRASRCRRSSTSRRCRTAPTRLKSATSRFETRLRRRPCGRRCRARHRHPGQSSTRCCSRAEHALAPAEGLPSRPWYRQLLSAPGWYTGYAAKTMPGVREAIEGKRWDEAEAQAGRAGTGAGAGGGHARPGLRAAGARGRG